MALSLAGGPRRSIRAAAGGGGDLSAMPEALFRSEPDRLREFRVAGHEPVEVALVKHEQPNGALRRHGSGTGEILDQGDFAEEVAGR